MRFEIYRGDCREQLKRLPDNSVDCCITSPPYYGLRDYGVDNQIGLEETPEQYIDELVSIFRDVKRVLKDDGTLWVNIGDTYNASSYHKDTKAVGNSKKQLSNVGSYDNVVNRPMDKNCKPKDLIGIPWMLAFALRADGFYLRQDIIWDKVNPMPEPVKDRCVKSHEYIFLLSKSPRYYFDYAAIQEEANYDGRKDTVHKGSKKYDGVAIMPNNHPQTLASGGHERWDFTEDGIAIRNKRDVWRVPNKPTAEAHFATFPPKLIEPMILAGSREGGTVLDPFSGSGTTGLVSLMNKRNYVGIELNEEYIQISLNRLRKECANCEITNVEVNDNITTGNADVYEKFDILE